MGPFNTLFEKNLEIFLLICGTLAMTLSGFVEIPDEETGWSLEIIKEAVTASLHVGDIACIPTGIFQIVLIVSLIIYKWHVPIYCSSPLFQSTKQSEN
jgi:predicted cation transporter